MLFVEFCDGVSAAFERFRVESGELMVGEVVALLDECFESKPSFFSGFGWLYEGEIGLYGGCCWVGWGSAE